MTSLKFCLRLAGLALGSSLLLATPAPADPEHVTVALPIATVPQSSTLSIATPEKSGTLPILSVLTPLPDPPEGPAETPQPHFLCFYKDFAPAPKEAANAKTLQEFALHFLPTAGKHEEVFVHPWTKQPVRVWFTLPKGKWQVTANTFSIAITSKDSGQVQIIFQPFGKVNIAHHTVTKLWGGG
jgi:hypothetical protein